MLPAQKEKVCVFSQLLFISLNSSSLGDGAQPQCRRCQARGDLCRWGLKASFHPSRTLQLSSEDSAALLAIEEERDQSGGQPVTTVS
jgi:hypothetical protein